MADNYYIAALGDEPAVLDQVLKIAMERAPGKSATHIAQHRGALLLLWTAGSQKVCLLPEKPVFYDSSDSAGRIEAHVEKLPFKLTGKSVTGFVQGWLEAEAVYEKEPGIDGSCKKGFYVTTGDGWRMIGRIDYVVALVMPAWTMYGK